MRAAGSSPASSDSTPHHLSLEPTHRHPVRAMAESTIDNQLYAARRPGTADRLTSQNDTEWDAFVTRHPLGRVYHLSKWKQVIEDAFPHIKIGRASCRERV